MLHFSIANKTEYCCPVTNSIKTRSQYQNLKSQYLNFLNIVILNYINLIMINNINHNLEK